MSQIEFAERTGVNQYQISRYERGVGNPSVDVLITMARALNTTADYLLGLSSVPHPGAEPDPYPDLTPTERDVVAILRQQDAKNQARLVEILRLAAQVPPPEGD
jgi:transcriptional regulator with XRE-family HTH domain